MPDASSVLLQRLQAAFDTVVPGSDPVLRVSDRADYQANGALALAKEVGRPPRQLAEEVVAAASLDDICSEVEVSGPGFINLTLSNDFVAAQVAAVSAHPRLGVEAAEHPETVAHAVPASGGRGDPRHDAGCQWTTQSDDVRAQCLPSDPAVGPGRAQRPGQGLAPV
jgi:hypothetical protein